MSAYPPFIKAALTAYLSGATLKALLVDNSYVQGPDDEFVADVVAAEISPSGYSRQTLSSVSVIFNDVSGEVYIAAADVNFGTFTQANLLGPIFYVDHGSDATNRLIGAATDDAAINVTPAVATIFRIDPDQGIFVGTNQ